MRARRARSAPRARSRGESRQAVDALARSSSPSSRRSLRRPSSPPTSIRRSRSSTRSISGTAYPHDVVTRSTSTSMIARCPGNAGKSGASSSKPGVPTSCTVPRAVDARDARVSRERAGHQRDASVLAEVRDRLDAAAGQVEVGDALRPEDAQRVVSLWRQVDVPAVARRRGRDEEHRLLAPPLRKVGRERGEAIGHASILSASVVHERKESGIDHPTGNAGRRRRGRGSSSGRAGPTRRAEPERLARTRAARRTRRGATTSPPADAIPTAAGTGRS